MHIIDERIHARPGGNAAPRTLVQYEMLAHHSRATTPAMRVPTIPPALINWGAWTCVALLLAQQTYLVRIATGSPISWWSAFQGTIGGSLLWAVFTPGILWVSRRWRVESLRSAPLVLLHLAFGTLLCAMDVLFNMALAAMQSLPAGSFSIGFLRLYPFNITCYFAVVAIAHAIDFARLYRERAIAEAELAAELSTARLRMLESQLRPHFLFNTLNTIAEQVHSNPQGADDMILRLGALLRASLRLSEDHEIALRDEMATVTHYLEIVRTRYADRLDVTIDIPAELETYLVPAMVLQPLVENALQHGVEPVDRRTQVTISAVQHNRALVLTVADDGAGISASAHAGGVGLANTRARLTHLYGAAGQLVLRAGATGGTISEVTIPIEGIA